MQHFRVASNAVGEREVVYVHVYPTLEEMWRATEAWAGNDAHGAEGATQAIVNDDERAQVVVVRLAATHLTHQIVSHEIHHAAVALYGAHIGDRVSRRAHFHHYNERLAYLFSDLYRETLRHLS